MHTTPGVYRERLRPSGWTLAAIAGFALFTYIAIVVADERVALITAPLVLIGGIAAAWFTAPSIEVRDGHLRAGRAQIPVDQLGAPQLLDRTGTARVLGPGFDPRTYACLRTGTGHALLLDVLDPQDPTPSWLVSTRRPRHLAEAINGARSREPQER